MCLRFFRTLFFSLVLKMLRDLCNSENISPCENWLRYIQAAIKISWHSWYIGTFLEPALSEFSYISTTNWAKKKKKRHTKESVCSLRMSFLMQGRTMIQRSRWEYIGHSDAEDHILKAMLVGNNKTIQPFKTFFFNQSLDETVINVNL